MTIKALSVGGLFLKLVKKKPRGRPEVRCLRSSPADNSMQQGLLLALRRTSGTGAGQGPDHIAVVAVGGIGGHGSTGDVDAGCIEHDVVVRQT